MMERGPVPTPKKEQEDFSKEENAFFESAPVGGYDGYIAPPAAEAPKPEEGFSPQEEAFFNSAPPTEYASADDSVDPAEEAKLVEARAMLDAALEDAPTEENNVVSLRPAASEAGFGKLADDFFQEGVEKYGANGDNEPDDDGEALQEEAA